MCETPVLDLLVNLSCCFFGLGDEPLGQLIERVSVIREVEGIGQLRPPERVDLRVPLLQVVGIPGDEARAWLVPGLADDQDCQRRLLFLQAPVLNDAERLRAGTSAQVMASVRNTAVAALRLAGFTGTAAGRRWAARNPARPLAALNLT